MKDLTIEELIELAKTEGIQIPTAKSGKKKNNYPGSTDASKYILAMGLIPGEHKIPAYVIYYNYKKWKKTGRPQSMVRFFKTFASKFEKIRTNKSICYKIGNPEILNTSEAFMEEAYADLRKEITNVQQKRLTKKNKIARINAYLEQREKDEKKEQSNASRSEESE